MTATNPSENSRSEDCLILNFSFKLAITSGFTIQGLEKRDELYVICLGLPLGSTISPRWMVLLYKLANLFVSHFGVVIKQKMRARGDLANLDVARAQPGQVRKGSVLFSKKEETRYRQVEEFFQQPPGIGFCDRLETVGMVRAHVSIQCHVVSGNRIVRSRVVPYLQGKSKHPFVVAPGNIQVLRREVELFFRHSFRSIHDLFFDAADLLIHGRSDRRRNPLRLLRSGRARGRGPVRSRPPPMPIKLTNTNRNKTRIGFIRLTLFLWLLPHASRRAHIGSTLIARRAGRQLASSATPISKMATPTNVKGSVGLTP